MRNASLFQTSTFAVLQGFIFLCAPLVPLETFAAAPDASTASHGPSVGELKVLDRLGLVRLVSQISGTAELELTLAGDAELDAKVQVLLMHVDGLSPNLKAESISKGVFRVHRVPPGAWKVVFFRSHSEGERGVNGKEETNLPQLNSVHIVRN